MQDCDNKQIEKIIAIPLKSLFYTNRQTWWLIGFSMIISGGILTFPQVITSFIIEKDFSGIWIIWSALLGTAFGKVFFAHLWNKIPTKTENELILFRFSGTGAKILHIFRSLYVGGLIAPLALSVAFIAFGRIVASLFDISENHAILSILILVIVTTFFNSLKQRLKIDFIYLIIFVVCLITIFFFLYSNIGSLTELQQAVVDQGDNLRLIPDMGTLAFNSFLVFVLVQWWSASIIDFPNIDGQKFMAAKDMNTISKSVVLPTLFMSFFLLLIYVIPFYILMIDDYELLASGELAFLTILQNAIPSHMYFIVMIFFLLPFLSVVNNTQNWSSSLIIQNFYIHYINKNASDKQINRKGLVIMLLIVTVSALIAIMSDSILDVLKYLFVITAGVGPVFILRWYWHRINAWSQLSAMILSLIYPNVYELLFQKSPLFKHFIESLMDSWAIDYYPLKIVLLTIIVSLSWIAITYLTNPTDENTTQRFAETVKPGGFWKHYQAGNSMFFQRLFTAVIFTLTGFLFYFSYWQFARGAYIHLFVLFSAYAILTYYGFVLLKRVNRITDYGER